MTANDRGYTAKFVRFFRVEWHLEAYRAAFQDQSGSSTNELRRLGREFVTLPHGHACSCQIRGCPRFRATGYACPECSRIRANEVRMPEPVEYGAKRPPDSTMPSEVYLDLSRALDALGPRESAWKVAQWLNLPNTAQMLA